MTDYIICVRRIKNGKFIAEPSEPGHTRFLDVPDNSSDIAVSQRYRLIQLGLDGANCGRNSICSDFVQHHFDFVGLLTRLLQQTGLAELALEHRGGRHANPMDP